MLAKRLQIYKDCFELINVVPKVHDNLPRDIKHTIGQRMITTATEMQHNIILANRRMSERESYCERIVEGVEEMGVYYRVLTTRRNISSKHEARLTELLVKIGRQANGWKNSVRKISGACGGEMVCRTE